MSQPEISIVIPTYNSQKYIPDLLQSLEGIVNAELIFVDDGSRDNTIKCIKSQVNNMSSSMVIRVIESSHGGPSTARNLGVSEAYGRYIVFVDSDDLIDSTSLNRAILSNFSEDIISFSNKSRDRVIKSDDEKYDLIWKLVKNSGTQEYLAGPWSKFFRTEFLRKNNISFPDSVYKGEDLLFNVEAILSTGSIRFTQKSFYEVRLTENSITRSIDKNALKNSYNFMQVGVSLITMIPEHLDSISDREANNMKQMLLFNSYKNDVGYALRHQLSISEITRYQELVAKEFGKYVSTNTIKVSPLEAIELWMVDKKKVSIMKAYSRLMGWINQLRQR